MGSSPRDRLFGRDEDDIDPSQALRRDGEHGTHARIELPTYYEQPALSRREQRARQQALEQAERRRAAGDTDIDYNPNRRRGIVPLIVALVVVVVASGFAWRTLGLSIPSFESAEGGDYAGTGESKTVEVTVNKGDAGSTVGSALVKAGVTKSTSAFIEAMAANPKANLLPGTYRLHVKQSASSALTAILDPKNRTGGVTIPEGLWQSEIFARLSKATSHPVSEYEKVSAGSLGLPPTMKGKLEGWLFPSTYDFDKKMSAQQQLQAMVKQTRDEMASLNLPADKYQDILTKASIVQAESPNTNEDSKVARVIDNRIAKGMPLQMDSSVHYILHKRGTVTTTDKDRSSSNPYNTYTQKGLPPTPYNSPGLAAIKASANPTPGDWLYFVAVDLNTGETRFTADYAEHEKNVKKFQQWCQAHPGKGC